MISSYLAKSREVGGLRSGRDEKEEEVLAEERS